MRRESLPLGTISTWAKLNSVSSNGVEVAPLLTSRGSGLVITAQRNDEDSILVTVPKDLIISLENVWIFAKSDKHLKDVLEAVGEYARTARGAILLFLLVQITNTIAPHIPLPTFWNDEERALLAGTSIEAALDAKLKILDREFTFLRDSTSPISWCQQFWWDAKTGGLKFDDWKQVDATYRSRALDLPGTGHAMVPYIDMANHASGEDTVALYETDEDGNAVLLLRDGKSTNLGEEITITYGDEKGACEMLFSYGFIEETMKTAQELFLDLEIPGDDPLKIAKKAINNSAPGFRLFLEGGVIQWEGAFVWLICVNEEDGLGFSVLQTNDGERELKVNWKDSEMTDILELNTLLKADFLWDVFELRAVATLQTRVESQLCALHSSEDRPPGIFSTTEAMNPRLLNASRLRELERTLMLLAYENFDNRKSQLLGSKIVQDYLAFGADQGQATPEDDFS